MVKERLWNITCSQQHLCAVPAMQLVKVDDFYMCAPCNIKLHPIMLTCSVLQLVVHFATACIYVCRSCSSGATRLENTHGSMHVNIGGTMSSVPTAAK